jgi:hypothetical protein
MGLMKADAASRAAQRVIVPNFMKRSPIFMKEG